MLLNLLIFQILLLAIPGVYIYWRLHKAFPQKKIVKVFGLIHLVMLAVFFIITADTKDGFSQQQAHALSIYIIVFIAFGGSQLCIAFLWAIGQLMSYFLKKPIWDKFGFYMGMCFAVLVVLISFYGSFWGVNRFETTHEEIRLKNLPKGFDGYKIVFFSDFHLGTFGAHSKFPAMVVDSILAQNANLILFGGDMVNSDAEEVLPYIGELKRIKAPDGVFSVLGNHDYMVHRHWRTAHSKENSIRKLKGIQRSIGWHLLLNSGEIITCNGDSIAVLGVENDGNPPFPQLGDLNKAQSVVADSPDMVKILLTHDPTHWRRRVLPETDIPLTLSGHTHACQFKIAGFSPAQWVYAEWEGLYENNGQQLFVSSGIGEALLPFRFGAWPQINVITLRAN